MSKKETNFWEEVKTTAKKQRRRVGVGINKVTPRVVESLQAAQEYVDVVVVGKEIEGFECVPTDTFDPLLEMAKDGRVDALVRGNFDALDAYNAARRVLGIEGSLHELNFFKLNGVNFIDDTVEGIFALLPGSFVNDRTLLDKMNNIDMHIEWFEENGIEPRIGILGPGKPVDVYDGVEEVNQGLAEGAFLEKWYSDKGYTAKYFNHQIEYAVQEANIVVAQNSWAGNLAAHCLLYLGNVDFIGSVIFNIKDLIYVDDSEAMEDFLNCCIFAAYLANKK